MFKDMDLNSALRLYKQNFLGRQAKEPSAIGRANRPLTTDIIILPEMFTTGFTMAGEKFAENMQGETVQWLHQWAEKKQAAVGGSTIIKEDDKIFNRFLLVSPSGEVQYYDKRHYFYIG